MKQKNENLNEQEIMIANKGIAKQMEREILIDVYGVDGEIEVELEKMSDYKQKRQELIQNIMQKHPSLKEDGLGQKLEQVYGINLGQDLMPKGIVSMWAIARHFNTGMDQERIFYVLQNMTHNRQLSDEENRKSIF